MAIWVFKDWKKGSDPGHSGVTLAHAETGEHGYGKTTEMWQELLGALLAAEVGVLTPPAETGHYNGNEIVVSRVWDSKSMDVADARAASGADDAALKDGLRKATGALAYHAWVGTGDLKDGHLVVRGTPERAIDVGSIDFADAFNQGSISGDVQIKDAPASIIENRDPAILDATITRIEGTPREQIEATIARVPDTMMAPPVKAATLAALDARKTKLRQAFRNKGWLPG